MHSAAIVQKVRSVALSGRHPVPGLLQEHDESKCHLRATNG
jgi:hypothetical protein